MKSIVKSFSSTNTGFTQTYDRNILLIHILKKGICFTLLVYMFCVCNFLKIYMVKCGLVIFGVVLCLGTWVSTELSG